MSEYFQQPEQREDAVCLISTEDRMVLRQQVCLVQAWRHQSFLIQKSHQQLHAVPASKRSGVIDGIRLWLQRTNEPANESQKLWKQPKVEILKQCKCTLTVWMFRPEKKSELPWQGLSRPRRPWRCSVSERGAAGRSSPSAPGPSHRLRRAPHRRCPVPSPAPPWWPPPAWIHTCWKTKAARVCREIHLFWTGIFFPSAEHTDNQLFTFQRFSQRVPSGASLSSKVKPRTFVFFRRYTAASLLINSAQTKSWE